MNQLLILSKALLLNVELILMRIHLLLISITETTAASKTDGDHTLVASSEFIDSDIILGKAKIEAPVLFKGIAHSINPTNIAWSASPPAANSSSKLSILVHHHLVGLLSRWYQ